MCIYVHTYMYFCIQTFIIITNLECDCERNANEKKTKQTLKIPTKLLKQLQKSLRINKRTDMPTDGRINRCTYVQTDRRTDGHG